MVSNMQAQADAYEVGGRIRDARKERGMNQERLAELVDCGLNTVSRIEVGQSNMPISTFFKFADALGVAPGELAPHRFRERDRKAAMDCVTENQVEELITIFLKSNPDDRAYLLKTARLVSRT